MTDRTPNADMYLLDVVADDIEAFDHILDRLNGDLPSSWWRKRGAHFSREEVVEGLTRLVTKDLVRVYVTDPVDGLLVELAPRSLPPSDYGDASFCITPRGLMVHAAWDPDPLD